MKMVKKILLGLAAGTLVLGFAGCKPEVAGNEDLIKISGKSGSIDYTNDSDDTTRGFKTLKTKHLDAICHIETTVTDLVDKTVNNSKMVSSGTMGYIFNVVKNEEENTYNFSIAGVRYVTGKNVQAYVESFKDVPADELEKGIDDYSENKCGETYTGFGFELLSESEVNTVLSNQSSEPKKLELWIDLVANGKANKNDTKYPKGRGDDLSAGTYTVSFYKGNPERKSTSGSYDLTYNESKKSEYFIKSLNVPSNFVNAAYNAEKGLTSMQSDVGFYANVYAGQTLKGKWELEQIKAEAEEIEE